MFNNKLTSVILFVFQLLLYVFIIFIKGFCVMDIFYMLIMLLFFLEFLTIEYKQRVKLNEELIYNIKTIIHDLKNPIQSLMLFVDYLKYKYTNDKDLEQMYKVLNDLYNYIESNKKIYLGVQKKEKIDISINEIINIVKRINEYTFKDTNILVYNCSDYKIKNIYPYYLIRIFQNILSNIIIHNDIDEILVKCINDKSVEIIFKLKKEHIAKSVVKKLRIKYFISKYFYTGTGLSIIYKLTKINNIKVLFYEKNGFVITKLLF